VGLVQISNLVGDNLLPEYEALYKAEIEEMLLLKARDENGAELPFFLYNPQTHLFEQVASGR
jgi:hypothetical protein